MVIGKIFIPLVLIAGSSLAYSVGESLWGQRVFPDDVKWPSLHRRKHVIESEKETNENNDKVCETPACKKVAEEFLTSINKAADPCNDFYEFTCGAWKGKNIIPPYLPSWNRFMIFDYTVKQRIKSVLEIPPAASDILPVRQAKKWYHSCMDVGTIEQLGLSPIESVLMENGGWPIAMDEEEWDSEENSWQNVERHYGRLRGSYAFFTIKTGAPQYGAKFGYLLVERPVKTLSDALPISFRNYGANVYTAYAGLIKTLAKVFVDHNHANVSDERLTKEAIEIVQFENELFQIQKSINYVLLFKELDELCETSTAANEDPKAKIDMRSMIQELFDTVNIKIDPQTGVTFVNGPYIKELSDLLARTSKRTIVNYIHWTFIGNMLMYTTETIRNALLAFSWEEFGIKERRPRWLECVTDMKMSHATAYVFVDKYFTNTTKHAALDMIQNIRDELREKIANSNWLDDKSKIIAKDKLDSMNVLLGFPAWYKNRTAVINHYKGITISTNYFENTLSYIRHEIKRSLKQYIAVRKPEENWFIDPITVNALYGPELNILNLPAVDFQAPLFTPHLPDAVNYGVAGVIIGHEMGHGFDDSGIQYSKYGNTTELPENVLMSYYQRAQCFSQQFKEYYRDAWEKENMIFKPDPEILASLTRGENIADTTGVQAVFQAFKKVKKQGLRLPGLEEYTPEQLFFMSFAAVWCEVKTPQYEAKSKLAFDEHSPAKLRVIGSVSNTKDFARVFNCPVGSEMNPTNKCNIWAKSEINFEEKNPFLSWYDDP